MVSFEVDTPAKGVLFSTVRLEVETGGEPWYGTALMYACGGEKPENYFLVTCRHVVEGARRGHLFFTRAESGRFAAVGDRVQLTIEDFERKWFFHPNPRIDIAVAPMVDLQRDAHVRVPIYVLAIDRDAIPTPAQLRELDVIEEVVFIGYPAGYYDRKNLLPIARRGITASAVQLDYNGRPEFLVDGAVYFGSSGSPVFIIREQSDLDQIRTMSKYLFKFLGVISEVLRTTFDGQVGFIHPAAVAEGVAAARLLNLGVVLKAHLIEEAIRAYLDR